MESTDNYYRDAAAFLSSFVTGERLQRFGEVLGRRTRYMGICIENIYHPHNASALIRHCDAFGIQDLYAIETLCKFRPSTDIVKGTDQWITFHRHKSTSACLANIKEKGYRVVATSPGEGSVAPEDFDVSKGTFVVFFGTEHEGISEEVLSAADDCIKIPMCGFVESLNVSASAAIIMHVLTTKMHTAGIDLSLREDEKEKLMFEWLKRSVRDSWKLLRNFDRERSQRSGLVNVEF